MNKYIVGCPCYNVKFAYDVKLRKFCTGVTKSIFDVINETGSSVFFRMQRSLPPLFCFVCDFLSRVLLLTCHVRAITLAQGETAILAGATSRLGSSSLFLSFSLKYVLQKASDELQSPEKSTTSNDAYYRVSVASDRKTLSSNAIK